MTEKVRLNSCVLKFIAGETGQKGQKRGYGYLLSFVTTSCSIMAKKKGFGKNGPVRM